MMVRAARPMFALAIAGALSLAPLTGLASAQAEAPEQAQPPKASEPASKPARQPPKEVKILTPEDMLRADIARLKIEIQAMREKLAQAQLEASQAKRELEELRQFLADHQQLGEDFEKYKGFLDLKERELRKQRAEEYRKKAREMQAEREARMAASRAERAERDAQRAQQRRYERSGFYHVGDDVYTSAMAYLYKSERILDEGYRIAPTIRFDGLFFWTRYWDIDYDEEIDWTEMTISGSMLNGADEPRSIGIAISFFDDYGNHVGGTTIEVPNARREAPYPFTDTLKMALDGPFTSYRIAVLYSEPANAGAEPEPVPTSYP